MGELEQYSFCCHCVLIKSSFVEVISDILGSRRLCKNDENDRSFWIKRCNFQFTMNCMIDEAEVLFLHQIQASPLCSM